uniref:Uncharacterized protein n=1 Tax=viral metagenome TaxID=1070528 RepID=A0A6M3LA23_9ZZZZ
MAVIKENEIELNSVKYPIIGGVRPILSSRFAEKMVVGDYTKASNPNVDSWVIQDQRGGILAEEMDESRQANRAWWSTCNLGFLGHIVLPPLVTAVTPTAINLVSPTTTTDTATAWTDDAKSIDDDYATFAYTTAGVATTTWSEYLQFNITSTNIIAVMCKSDIYTAAVAPTLEIDVTDGTWHNVFTGTVGTAAATHPEVVSAQAIYTGVTAARVRLKNNDTVSAQGCRIYEFYFITATGGTLGTPVTFANYNSRLYYASGVNLFRLNAAGTAWLPVAVLPSAVTALVSSVGNNLYVFMGDSEKYWYMRTGEVFTETSSATALATYAIAWDSKLFKMDSAGSMSYSAAPNVIAASWTDDGDLADEGLADNDVQGLFIYRDAAGSPIIYAGTKLGLYAHSFGNDKWMATELAMPQHDTAGKGVVHWRENACVSAGLDVLAYQTGQAGTSIVSVGLDKDDGLPQLYGGEVVKFIKGYNEFFALVDSTYEGTTSYSSVMAYDGRGWQSWWTDGTVNEAMHTGIVSSVVAHRLWFTSGTAVSWIALQKNIRNPKKVSTFPYATSSVHITPWFDANWVGQKLALNLKVFCKDVTANETVLVQYRIDHATTAVATTWTTLGTIVAAGDGVETEYTFGSSLGTNFKAIQFKFTLVRRTTGTTPEYYSPDIQYAVLEYEKVIDPTWGWAFTINCNKPYAGKNPEQLLDALVTAAELETLTPFAFKGTTYYVRVKSVEGERLTGDGDRGTYNVTVLKPT